MVTPNCTLITKAARKIAKKSNHKFAHHAVFVMRGGALMAVGNNKDRRHAEVAALNKLWPSKRKGTTVISVRYTRSNYMASAKPCSDCEDYMREHGVKTVYYSDDNGEMQMMRL
jgi:cytidine deaminase